MSKPRENTALPQKPKGDSRYAGSSQAMHHS